MDLAFFVSHYPKYKMPQLNDLDEQVLIRK